jgi:hypothetical protein
MTRALVTLLAFVLGACGPAKSNVPKYTPPGPVKAPPAVANLQLSWTASTGTPSGYYVEMSTNGTTFNRIATTTATTYLVTGVPVGQTYFFRVSGYNAGGASIPTTVASVTP